MLPYDHDPLRVRLATDFALLSNGVKDAGEVSEILALLAQTTITALNELSEAWSRSNDLLWVFPDELLASFISFLPFEDRITASHVSRRWRTTALAYPAIWADLSIPMDRFRDQNRIVRMALSRSGSHPVDMRGFSQADPEGIIPQCLLEHMHHLRLIEWDLPRDALPLTLRAPLLETVACYDYHIDIPSDFLGGQPERLQRLDVRSLTFPTTCPALSTITTVKLGGASNFAPSPTFARLFDLCPNLQSLYLTEMSAVFSASLPHGPAPPSLHTLELASIEPDYDLSPHYVDWRTDGLLAVSIEQQSPTVSHLDQLVRGARVLVLGRDTYFDMTYITAKGAGGRANTVTFGDDNADTARTANMLLAVQSRLRRVSSLNLPLAFLTGLFPVLAVLPKLRRLTVSLEPEIHTDSESDIETHRFTWDGFDGLSRVGEHCSALEQLVLDVFCPGEGDCPLSSDDARDLLAGIASLDELAVPEVCIEGFPFDVVSGLEIPELDGVRISFAADGPDDGSE